jgi:iron complex transport system ATP-binding protein
VRLQAQRITVEAAGCAIVSDADLELAPGELVGLIGPNGAGKSTLMRAIVGVLPHRGEVLLDAIPDAHLPPRAKARMLAYLPQERRVEWAISVRELVALGRHPFERRFARHTPDDHEAVGQALAEVGLAGIATRSAKVLSSGELALALLARALAVGAPLLLADEPIAALDPYHQLHVMDLLRQRASAGTGVLAVLHDLTLASRFCDRVVVMRQGQVVREGSPRSVIDAALLEDVYGVAPLIGEHEGKRWVMPWRRSAPL